MNRLRIGDRLLLGGWLVLLWCLLWGLLSLAVVASGLVVAVAALVASRLPFLPVSTRLRWHRLPRALGSLVVDLARSSVEVTAATASRRTPRAAVVTVSLPDITDVETTVVANRLSLVPGTLVVDVDRANDTLYVYVTPIRDLDDARRKEAHAVQIAEQIIGLFVRIDRSDQEDP